MHVVVIVLNRVELLDELLAKLNKAGIRGGTVLDSTGMVKHIDNSNDGYILGSLKLFLDNPYPESKTMFFIVRDDQIDIVRKTLNDVVGNISNHNTGIIFGFPLSFADGLYKQ